MGFGRKLADTGWVGILRNLVHAWPLVYATRASLWTSEHGFCSSSCSCHLTVWWQMLLINLPTLYTFSINFSATLLRKKTFGGFYHYHFSDPLGCRHEDTGGFPHRCQLQILDIRWWADVSNAWGTRLGIKLFIISSTIWFVNH